MATTLTPSRTLAERDLRSDPFDQFRHWYDEAVDAGIPEAGAMALATSTPDGVPSVRTVLLKNVSIEGFIFYTNYSSRKGTDISSNPAAALLFHWQALDRQVRMEGKVRKIPAADSEAYFLSRPRGSQISAVISHQSQIIGSRSDIENRSRTVAELYRGQNIPCPSNWGGYVLVPHVIEFWQGRDNRLHDRLAYTRQQDGLWIVMRLAP